MISLGNRFQPGPVIGKRIFMVLALLTIVAGLVACKPAPTPTLTPATPVPPTPTPAPAELKVAILVTLSGDVATYGESTRDGAFLAIDEWNAK